ncbi:cysteine desulfurase [Candidatus Saccharibacteria bacterium]|nr:cysteine desulfurase [Candidatus Saccharibacteria bacterium]
MSMIYLDHASATPLSKKAKAAMEPFFADDFFNPSAPYLPAKRVREAYENAKSEIAHTIGAKANDLVMTSGATEATNLAFSVLNASTRGPDALYRPSTPARLSARGAAGPLNAPPLVLVLETEHASVLRTAENYGAGKIKVKPGSGLIDLDNLKSKITKDTVLISVAAANNELGTIQPLAEIAEIIKSERQARLKNKNPRPLYLHSDASAALGLLNINVARMKTDLLTLSSAKIYGPKGVGALYVAHGVKLKPLISGGGQERNLRSGTENVPGAIGFAAAMKETKDHLNSAAKTFENLKTIFKNSLTDELNGEIEPVFLGPKKRQLANFCPVSFPGLDAERLVYKLEEKEVYLSTGAACAASKGEKSHVLKAAGLTDKEIAGSLRISFGRLNDEAKVKTAANLIADAVKEELERLKNA